MFGPMWGCMDGGRGAGGGRERLSRAAVKRKWLLSGSPDFPVTSLKEAPAVSEAAVFHGFLIKMINEPRIDKKRQLVFGLCIVLVTCIFHSRP